jgi:putative RecB family exonuclease
MYLPFFILTPKRRRFVMSNIQPKQVFQNELSISYSQIFVYLSCSLKFKFMYIEKRPHERLSASLPFGSGIHNSIARFYRSLKENGSIERLPVLQEIFEDRIRMDLERAEVPIIYKKETPDRESLINMGKSLLRTFHESVGLDGMEIVDVELPLTANLYTEDGKATEFKLVGIVDLLLRNKEGELIAVENKTAAKPKSQSTVDDDLQFTSYSYLLAANKYVFPTAPVQCRMDVLRKLKTPKREVYETVRTAQDRKKFAKIANAVLAGIESRVFIPTKSFFCSDCQFIKACEEW